MNSSAHFRDTEYTRTPSPGRSDCRKHSPWTADRVKKKRKEKSPDWKLPDVAEDAPEPSPPKKGPGVVSPASQDLSERFVINPFCASWEGMSDSARREADGAARASNIAACAPPQATTQRELGPPGCSSPASAGVQPSPRCSLIAAAAAAAAAAAHAAACLIPCLEDAGDDAMDMSPAALHLPHVRSSTAALATAGSAGGLPGMAASAAQRRSSGSSLADCAPTPAPAVPDEQQLLCSQESNGALAPLKAANAGAAPALHVARGACELATFNDRLHEAVAKGDAVTVGQAWQQVRGGDVRPDVDSLNTLLKCFCRVSGDAAEAEAVVKAAVRGGLRPNASTYHLMAGLWLREEQLASDSAQ
ncbi:hypothetical protein WJX81_006660 [Elliptochloris bilobata]|uniref:Uncharacterized protein n=1 Tax=Elliptochloris bilobata TaxID=381761 RepID=A0AAW1SIV8_9CHLO